VTWSTPSASSLHEFIIGELKTVTFTASDATGGSAVTYTLDPGGPLLSGLSIVGNTLTGATTAPVDTGSAVAIRATDNTDPTVFSVRLFSLKATPAELYPFQTHTFTNCGASGRYGPTFAEMKSVYGASGWWQTEANFNEISGKQGFQLWTVPKDGTYTIKAYGASGGVMKNYAGASNSFGYGAWTQGNFLLTQGEKLVIIVGQYDIGRSNSSPANAAGGGGASWVLTEDYGGSGPTRDDLYLVAGGGGGVSVYYINSSQAHASYSQASINSYTSSAGSGQWQGGGGASWGTNGQGTGTPGPSRGMRPYEGANGGNYGYNSTSYNNVGGFGGGGGSGAHAGGGGGGYNGGKASTSYSGHPGSGGTSRNNGQITGWGQTTTQSHGKVIITRN